MPELAALFFVGFIVCCLISGWHFYLIYNKQNSSKMLQLQKNLQLVGKYWSDSQSSIEDFFDGCIEADKKKNYQSALLFSVIFAFLSWAGVLFNLIYIFSSFKIAVSRLERNLFSSALVEKDLSAQEVQQLLV